MKSRTIRIAATAATAALFSTAAASRAANTVTDWTGNGTDNLWTDSANWDTGVPNTGYAATFNGAGNSQANVGLGGTTQNVSSIVFTGTPAAYTLGTTAGDTFNFGSGAGVISVGPATTSGYTGGASQAIAGNVIENGGLTINNAAVTSANAPTLLTISGSISGSGNVTFSSGTSGNANGGNILLSGNNTYTGNTLVNSTNTTTILIGSNTVFGTGIFEPNNTSNTPLEAYGANITLGNAVTLLSGMTISDSLTNPQTAYNLTFAGNITFNASKTLTFTNYGQVAYLGAAGTSSTITLPTAGSAAIVIAVEKSTSAATLVLNDAIQDPAGTTSGGTEVDYGAVNNSYTPGNVIINGTNTYSGATVFRTQASGTLGQQLFQIGSNSPFGTGSVSIQNGGLPPIFEPIGGDRTIPNVTSITKGLFVATAPTTGTDVTVDPTGPHSLIFSGAVTDAGTVITNNITGGGKGLYFGTAAAPSTLTLSTTNAATFQSQLTTAGGGNTLFYDQITGTASVVFKQGGTYQLFNSNTYAGTTTITGGTVLALNVTGSATGTAAVGVTGAGTVVSGGVLGGTGTIAGAVTISSTTPTSQGGILAPGVSGPGTLTVGSLVLNPGGQLTSFYNGSTGTPGGGVNSLVLSGGTLDVSALSAATPFTLNLSAASAGTGVTAYVLGTFSGGIVNNGVTYAGGADLTALFTLAGTAPFPADVQVVSNSDGSQSLDLIDIAAAPEPSALALLGFTATAAIGRRRRRP